MQSNDVIEDKPKKAKLIKKTSNKLKIMNKFKKEDLSRKVPVTICVHQMSMSHEPTEKDVLCKNVVFKNRKHNTKSIKNMAIKDTKHINNFPIFGQKSNPDRN